MRYETPIQRRDFLQAAILTGGAVALSGTVSSAAADREKSLPFRAGAGIAEITPPLVVGLLMSSTGRRWAPFEEVRLPLYARAVVIARGARRVGVVALDLLGLAGEAVDGMQHFKSRIAAAAGQGWRADDFVLVSTHTHSGPESIALTDLYRTEPFRGWVGQLAERIGAALRAASESLRPCRLLAATGAASGLAVNRRIRTAHGIVLRQGPLPSDQVIGPEGPNDENVHVAALLDQADQPVAILVGATCHPVHEMCIKQVSPDYPGEMIVELQRRHPHAAFLFLQGTAGNINPLRVSAGAAEARQHGRRLADCVDGILRDLRPVDGDELAIRWRGVRLPARTVTGEAAAEPLLARIAAICVGRADFVFLPGEPFVEIGLAIRDTAARQFMIVTGYADDYVGYIPTDRALLNGGYEVSPGRWSQAASGSEQIIRQETISLLSSLHEKKAGSGSL